MTNQENKNVLKNNVKYFIYKIITSVLIRVALLIMPIFYSYGIDSISTGDYTNAYTLIIIYCVSYIIYRVIEMLNQKSFYVLYSKLYKTYLKLGLKKTFNNSIYSLSRLSLPEFTNIMSEDFEVMSDFYSTLVIRIVELLEFLFILVYFFTMNTYIGISAIILTIIVLFILLIFSPKIQTTNETRKLKYDKRVSIFQELFLGVKEIKGFNIRSSINTRCEENVNEYTSWNNKLNVDRYNLRQILLALVDIFRIGSLIFGIYLISIGSQNLGSLLIIFNYYSKLSDSFTSVITLTESLTNYRVAKKRIFKLFQYAKDTKLLGEDTSDNYGKLTFDNILYGDKTNPILNHISFTLEPNSLNVITGPTGSGKTGVFDLLLRLNMQHTGSIYINDEDIRTINDDIYYNIVSAVRKEPTFFAVSIRENLTLIESNFERIIEVCELLDIHSYITDLKDGYDTILLSDASNINVEVKYLLALARVLLRNSRIILLDEIFLHADHSTKNKILKLLEELKVAHTIILISKNKDIINNKIVDHVLVLEKGTLLYDDKPSLLKENEGYRDFIKNM